MNAFTIRDLENLSGIRAHTIRIWEQRYNFLKPKRTHSNIRYYNSEELKTLLNISLLNRYGYKISHIDRMEPAEIGERIVALGNGEALEERMVNDLIAQMIDLNMEAFEELLDGHIAHRGIDKTITHLIFPFLDKIGILWQTNHINPAQEHLVTNVIRQKLIVGIEGAFSHISIPRTVLLFLPEGEQHEIGLLYTSYLLKSHGVSILYLGANVPLKDVEFVANLKKPDCLYTHLTTVAPNFNVDKFLGNYSVRCGGHPLVISGRLTRLFKKKLPENVSFKHSLAEVSEFISSLR
ncbi:MerR family transcriptional regulator [Flavihumibacter petaseus]|uniref:Putative MerR family transcriptional regulator n=1 Tax=Flavihumibacter petaseus NBRC 106054 TaxID=1220578 RepID=A0A0E9N5W4_9BACT|nr:MerR family transcriptional regulator [Flavihumibacter petaseus]GAO45193.1 putative MerR family transcriptional regulator [Flavihumibacter petaseus NBRC 106054]